MCGIFSANYFLSECYSFFFLFFLWFASSERRVECRIWPVWFGWTNRPFERTHVQFSVHFGNFTGQAWFHLQLNIISNGWFKLHMVPFNDGTHSEAKLRGLDGERERARWKIRLPNYKHWEKMFINLKFLDVKWLWRVARTCSLCFTVYNKCKNNELCMCYIAIVMWYWIHCARFPMNWLPHRLVSKQHSQAKFQWFNYNIWMNFTSMFEFLYFR